MKNLYQLIIASICILVASYSMTASAAQVSGQEAAAMARIQSLAQQQRADALRSQQAQRRYLNRFRAEQAKLKRMQRAVRVR